MLSGYDGLFRFLFRNSGFTVAEELRRYVIRGFMPNVDAFMSHPIADPEEFENCLRPQIANSQPDEDLPCCGVVHLFGHNKQDHVLLRKFIAKRMLQFLASGAHTQEFLFEGLLRERFQYMHTMT